MTLEHPVTLTRTASRITRTAAISRHVSAGRGTDLRPTVSPVLQVSVGDLTITLQPPWNYCEIPRDISVRSWK